MSKKWNLQDIRPIERNTSARPETRRQAPTALVQRTRVRRATPEMRRTELPAEIENDHESEFEALPNIEITNKQRKGKQYVLIASVIFFASLAGAFGIGDLTGGAKITIYPKVRSMNVNSEFTAYKERQEGELSYEILTLEATGERQLTATGQEKVSIQTEGELTIYKTTHGTERLIKNTRFESPDGKIFRIQESVVIPGATTNSEGKVVPGSVKAQVFADQAGAEYNLQANTRLTVPGFKESNLTELFNSVYATNASAFTGGFDGPRFIMKEEELANAQSSLRQELLATLQAKVASERPANYTTFEDSTTITYTSLESTQQADSMVTIKEQATLRIPIFANGDFASFIAKETIIGYETDEQVRIDNVKDLNFEYIDPTTKETNIANLDSIHFKIIGQPVVVWTFDENKLKKDLVGKEKTALPLALGKYSQESRSTVKIRPFWKSSFPESVDKIAITEVLETGT